jgi:nicotinate-nucleotide adenylyltransferase
MIGILGGTFDPVHFGHLRPALEMCEALQLEELRLIPSNVPPHRPGPVASPTQRLDMLRAAVGDTPHFIIDERELERDGPSYTIDTLISLRRELGSTSLCLLIGMDAFLGLPYWHRWHELIGHCHMVVMTRPGAQMPETGELAGFIERHRVDDAAALASRHDGYVLFQPVSRLEISGTLIRERLAAGNSARFLMPQAVLAIIEREGLYRDHERQTTETAG